MMKDKIVTADEAIALIQDGDSVSCSGFVGIGTPEELIAALERRYLETQGPRDLTLVFAAAPGDGKERGLNRLAHEGLIKRAVGGHWALVPKLARLATDNLIQAYNLPLGTISHLYRDIAAHRAGSLTKVGLGTFVDPRNGGGKINARTTEDLVRVMEIDGEEWLFYKAFPINVALIRGTTADPAGNITMEREALLLDAQAAAMAARNANGLVIAQVERIAASGSLDARSVVVPGVLVDCVVLAPQSAHPQTYGTSYNAAFSGRDSSAHRQDRSGHPRRAKDHRAPMCVRVAARRRHQSRHRRPRGAGRGRRRRARTGPPHADGRTRRDRRHAAGRAELRRGRQHAGTAPSEPAVRLLRWWRPRSGVPGHGRSRSRRQCERQPFRSSSGRRRGLHQHQPERAAARVRRNLHGRGAEGRHRGRQAAHRDGRTDTQVRPRCGTGDFQRTVGGGKGPVRPVRDRTLRVQADHRRSATHRGGAGHRRRARHPGAHGVSSGHP